MFLKLRLKVSSPFLLANSVHWRQAFAYRMTCPSPDTTAFHHPAWLSLHLQRLGSRRLPRWVNWRLKAYWSWLQTAARNRSNTSCRWSWSSAARPVEIAGHEHEHLASLRWCRQSLKPTQRNRWNYQPWRAKSPTRLIRQRAAAFIHAANSPRIFAGPLCPSGKNMPQVTLPPATSPKNLTWAAPRQSKCALPLIFDSRPSN